MKRLVATLLTIAAPVGAAALLLLSAGPATAVGPVHTTKITVRPVHQNGTPVAGYSVTTGYGSVGCGQGPSPVAVSDDIRFCGDSAQYGVACWRSTGRTVLCLIDPLRKQLVRYKVFGTFKPTSRLVHATPLAYTLVHGNYCTVRDGGAGGSTLHHPDWVDQYYCDHGTAVGSTNYGIVVSTHPWHAHLASDYRGTNTAHKVVDVSIATAYYVGTAS